ncbi:unnamed protein product [Rotaria magnacalcarata]|uniref:Glycerophosphocholine phosphodiesterase GPCPD1 n=2 Tax=Rotaria magnacalcarata TaxID=392030 RepID=A0A816MG65_9BILA|nr:unnamed protein product [Rotaria magnacalcarata]CAF2134623.1 unnamed protein product [Rotaria magnacalcarata]CAF3780160.1 unnamed protein product [Rotaria magnacalcarata]CAF3814213.1 unnamed protein product [Rotaria magnacalcarata]
MICRVIYEVEFRVLVKEKLSPSDSVLVTGSCEQLGEWTPNRCIPLTRIDRTEDGEIWSTNIKVNGPQRTFYRYVIAQIIRTDDDMNLIIKRWETFKEARYLIFNEIEKHDLTSTEQPQECFDVFGCYKNTVRTDIGWLTGQSEIQLRFHSNSLQIWSTNLRDKTLSLKVSPIDLKYQQENEEVTSESANQTYTPTSKVFIQSAILRLSGCETNIQSDYGAILGKDDYIIVKIQTFEPENVTYHIDFYLVDESTPLRKHIGFAYVLPVHSNLELADSKQLNRTVPIIGLKHNPIGQIKIDVLLITPLQGIEQKFLVSASKYWREGRRPVNVGHRGLGKTNTEHVPLKHHSNDTIRHRSNDLSLTAINSSSPPSSMPPTTRPVQTKFVSENTLASFTGAFQLGFDFVEFDVQLSKDKIPVVYHDFQVAITLKRKFHQAELFVVPVKDLTLPQLQSLKIYHASKTDVIKIEDDLDEDEPTGQEQFSSLFPTLQELFEQLDPHLGFNVEIKYAMQYRHGGSEQNYFFERNEYIDCILRCLITYANKRVIVLSTFDPDCASILRRKQTLFPVLFLTQGEKSDAPQFLDVRTWSINIGLCFIVAEHLSGLAAPALDIIADKDFVKHVKDNGKLLFIWGDEANDKDVSKCLIDLKVDGLIFDHAAELRDEQSTTENLFIAEEREELEVLNSFRERQLEIKHRQLLQELESLQTARETTNSSTAATNPPARSFGNIYSISEQCAIDSNFKDLM